MFDSVAREYVAEGTIVAFHWQFDTGDDTLTNPVETRVPDTEQAVFDKFSPAGSVPTIVIGGKYFRVGTAYEGASNGLTLEERDFRDKIDAVIREACTGPAVTTLAASSVTATGATLNGHVNPNGLATNAWFEWGTDPALTTLTTTTVQSVGSGTARVPVSQPITGLADNSTYYIRVAAQNSKGTSRGSIIRLEAGSSGVIYDEALATVLRGALIDNQAASALSIPSGYYRVREFRNFANTFQACITIGISRQYLESVLGYEQSSFPRESEEWVFSRWDSSSYDSSGRTAVVRDLHGHTLAFDIRFGQPNSTVNTVAFATIDGVPVGLSTQNFLTEVLNAYGWSEEPPWTVPPD